MQDSRNGIFNCQRSTAGSENCLTRTTRISPFHLSIFLHSTFLINVLLRVEKMKGRKRNNDQTGNIDIEDRTEIKETKKRKVIPRKFTSCLFYMPT